MHWSTINDIFRRVNVVFIPHLPVASLVRKHRSDGTRMGRHAAIVLQRLKHYVFLQRLIARAEEIGAIVIIVTEAYSSKTCCKCGTLNEDLGCSRKFKCGHCGHEENRDLHSTKNIAISTIVKRGLTW